MSHDDLLARLGAVDPLDGVDLTRTDRRAFDALREGITMTDRSAPAPAAASRLPRARRLGRRGIVATALSLTLLGGGAAYAGLHQWFGGIADGLNCQQTWNETAAGAEEIGGPELTGDPVADCQEYRLRAGLPALQDPVAFEYRDLTFVTPRDQVPEDAVLLAAPTAQDAAARELEASLRDQVDGLRASCADPAAAESFAHTEFDRLALTGWEVVVQPAPENPSPDAPCTDAMVDVAQRTVTVLPARAADADQQDPDLVALRDALRAGITQRCVSAGEAQAVVESALAELPHWPTTILVDEAAACARVDLEVGGSIQVTVHGPAVARP